MSSRQRNRRTPGPAETAPAPDTDAETDSSTANSSGQRPVAAETPLVPSGRIRAALSIGIAIHLLAVFIAFTSIVSPSGVHASIHDLVRPYLQLTHFFGADDPPYYLAHGDLSERAHRLEFSTVAVASLEDAETLEDWQKLPPDSKHSWQRWNSGITGRPGLAESDRYGRWLATAAQLAESDQAALVAQLLLPVVQADESIRSIRISRLTNDLDSVTDISLPSPYVARVVRNGQRISLVQLQETRLSSVAGQLESDNPSTGESQ